MDFKALKDKSRLLIEANLVPMQGTRFQPTGFPDLGAASYTVPGNNTQMLLLESAQSVANRLESTIWDEVAKDVVEPLRGIPYVVVKQGEKVLTNSLLEAHRINSPYILGTDKKKTSFFGELQRELGISDPSPINFHKLAKVLAKYDINCLLHGAFLEKIAGVVRMSRALSGFIEAKNVAAINSGGVKNDRVDVTGKAEGKGGAKEGFGNVIYHREEYTAAKITAYFNLDLVQIQSYCLDEAVEDLLIAIALYKIQSFLQLGLRLRTACDLDCEEVIVKRPEGFELPDLKTLTKALPALVAAAKPAFANPPVTTVKYEAEETAKKK